MSDGRVGSELGGLVLFGFSGTRPDEVPIDLVARAAGVILFRRNIQSPEQLRTLTDAIRAVPRHGRHPPIIALDQEGGTVSRLAGIGTTIPAAMALGAAADVALTRAMYELTGDELAALGITLDLAPVADLNDEAANPVVGTRSFGDDAVVVSSQVGAAIRGLHAAGVGATAKHFPGHGGSMVDSHFQLPVMERSLPELRKAELVPFAGAVAADVDCVMTAHAHYPAIEAAPVPATMSPAAIRLLRDELRFEGVIVTDCLEMQAVAARYEPKAAARTALAAGADLVLISHTTSAIPEVIEALDEALEAGDLRDASVRASLQRVEALGNRYARMTGARLASLAGVGSEQHLRAALDAARRAVVCVRDPRGHLPLSLSADDRVLVIEFRGSPATPVEDKAQSRAPREAGTQSGAHVRQSTAVGQVLAAGPARVQEQIRTLDPAGHEYKQILLAAGAASAVVIVTARATQHPLQVRVAEDLLLLGKRVIAVAAREPYDATVLPQEMTVLASFGDDDHALRAAGETILGTITASGRLPVRLAGFRAQAG